MAKFEIVEITQEQAGKICSIAESHFCDLKAKEIAPRKVTKAISAFANADGGELYIGIAQQDHPPHKWDGFADVEAANGHVQAIDECRSQEDEFVFQFLSCSSLSGLVLQITVPKSRQIVKTASGDIYVRRNARSHPVQEEEDKRRLELDKGLDSFERQPVAGADVGLLQESATMAEFLQNVVPTSTAAEWLRKQRLIRDDKCTVAGLMLYADLPQASLPTKCAVKIVRYKTTAEEGARENMVGQPVTIEGCAYSQIREAVMTTKHLLEREKVLEDEELVGVEYPQETLHEIIANAVLHRDYSVQDDIHVRIFDNRIEVQSPGRLPGHVSVSNILSERFSRNPSIVRLINKFPDPPNKDIGEGLNTAFGAMRKLGLREPVVSQDESSVKVIIRHEALATAEETVMMFLDSNAQINNSKGRELCYIGSENVMKRVFERLMVAGKIERVPDQNGRAAAYRKKQSATTESTLFD